MNIARRNPRSENESAGDQPELHASEAASFREAAPWPADLGPADLTSTLRPPLPEELEEKIDDGLRRLIGTSDASSWAATLPGRLIGRYQLDRCIGQGAMSVVLAARDTVIARHVAIKVLTKTFARGADSYLRFEREARAIGRVEYEGVARLYDIGEIDGRLFLAMEMAKGQTLRALMRQGRIDPERVVALVCRVCDAAHAIHEAGLVHRDLKPENIIVGPDDRIKVLDLGLAKWGTAEDAPLRTALSRGTGTAGTPGYMAPEQVRGADVDGRADVFSLGVILYELLFGRMPFAADSQDAVLQATLAGRIEVPVMDSRLDAAAMRRLLSRALATDREARFPNVLTMVEELRRIADGCSGSRLGKILLESTKAIPWGIDWRSKRFAYIGPQIEKLLGWPVDSWRTVEDWVERIHPEDRERVRDYCVAQSIAGIDHEADYRALAKHGGYIWLRDVVHVVRNDEGDVDALVGFMFDIDERKKAEKDLLELTRELQELRSK